MISINDFLLFGSLNPRLDNCKNSTNFVFICKIIEELLKPSVLTKTII